MEKSQLMEELKALTILTADSDDHEVRLSGAVLHGLLGAITAGGPFLELFINDVHEAVKRQLILVKSALAG